MVLDWKPTWGLEGNCPLEPGFSGLSNFKTRGNRSSSLCHSTAHMPMRFSGSLDTIEGQLSEQPEEAPHTGLEGKWHPRCKRECATSVYFSTLKEDINISNMSQQIHPLRKETICTGYIGPLLVWWRDGSCNGVNCPSCSALAPEVSCRDKNKDDFCSVHQPTLRSHGISMVYLASVTRTNILPSVTSREACLDWVVPLDIEVSWWWNVSAVRILVVQRSLSSLSSGKWEIDLT